MNYAGFCQGLRLPCRGQARHARHHAAWATDRQLQARHRRPVQSIDRRQQRARHRRVVLRARTATDNTIGRAVFWRPSLRQTPACCCFQDRQIPRWPRQSSAKVGQAHHGPIRGEGVAPSTTATSTIIWDPNEQKHSLGTIQCRQLRPRGLGFIRASGGGGGEREPKTRKAGRIGTARHGAPAGVPSWGGLSGLLARSSSPRHTVVISETENLPYATRPSDLDRDVTRCLGPAGARINRLAASTERKGVAFIQDKRADRSGKGATRVWRADQQGARARIPGRHPMGSDRKPRGEPPTGRAGTSPTVIVGSSPLSLR